MRRTTRSGFTLVELLVVISIIAMLASLLMPAVNRAREAARRTQCMNNMRNVALAMMQYDTAKQRLPGWANNLCPNQQFGMATNRDSSRASRMPSSWCFELLPYIEKGDLYYIYGPNNTDPGTSGQQTRKCMGTGMPQEHIKLLICPNDSGAVGAPNALSYVVNCGLRDHPSKWRETTIQGSGDHGGSHGSNYTEPPGNGVFHNNWKYGNVSGTKVTYVRNRTINSLSYISAGDGTSSTLMVSENVDAGYWHGSYRPQGNNNVYEGSICFCWTAAPPDAAASAGNNYMKINAKIGQDPYAFRSPRPSGNHDSGVNVIFCDAHSAFISENIDWMTWQLLHSANGRQTMKPDSDKYSNDSLLDIFRYTPLNEKF